MKLFFSMLLCFAILFSVSGCSVNGKEDVSFYYCRNDFIYGAEDGVIMEEKRNASGHTEDISYLLSLYLLGPMDDTLFSPFPEDVRLLSVDIQEKTVHVTLSELPASLSEAGITLAFGCLTLTCLEITDAEQVRITSDDRTVTMNRDSLLLFDDITVISSTEETK